MDDPESLLIRAFDHGAFSHVDAITQDGFLIGARSDVCLGVSPGVQSRPIGYAKFSVIKQVFLETTPECMLAFYAFLNQQIGKPYDKSAILAFAFDRDWRSEGSYFCSELIALALEKASYFSYPLSATANKITPADLLLALSATAPV